ncbi:M20 family metallo-hydrolase [Arthrobacter sp. zg-Y820]|uniref:M20 family metallo-hydrolase n=1 Tax=unclassified Arthrobacter TaxID=235627 RepID=UPI001E515CB6|nr:MULTISPECIES: M20 family metallo-hydrolase [unclassified Arthrobacter]MCC9196753.1 M20 family metallo-hydrolase [Arthrobacter sp. zg-Y820]MDK1279615.1 M20 family metallo-hydrolase [Arthrobacter sp. zg.Y820]WIB08014.1 M20 family metallo-hydrolase [Arthrobacter sp. zg-Y820]
MTSASFLSDFHAVAAIGATPNNGVDRQAATAEDALTRDWFAAWVQEAGWELRVDSIGNMFALLEWTPGAPFVIIGSHLDSQPLGGRFDGAYGVIAALHAARRISADVDAGGELPRFNLAVVNWFNEEGGRFAPSIMGSSVYAGLLSRDQMLAVTDLQGTSVSEALEGIGYLGTAEAPPAAGYAEIHIEQGRILEREGISIGVVDSSWYTQKLDIEVLGEQSHTGATAMADRHDALVAASRIILMVHDVTEEFADEALVSSVGQLTLEPNSPIVVARRVHLIADLRSGDPEVVKAARAKLIGDIDALARKYDIKVNVKDFDIRPIRRFPQEGLELAEQVAAGLGLSSRRIQTMAGHDSVAMNTVAPSVMLFIPSVDGVSHCEREFTTDEDMVLGLDMLTGVTRELISGALANSATGSSDAVNSALPGADAENAAALPGAVRA